MHIPLQHIAHSRPIARGHRTSGPHSSAVAFRTAPHVLPHPHRPRVTAVGAGREQDAAMEEASAELGVTQQSSNTFASQGAAEGISSVGDMTVEDPPGFAELGVDKLLVVSMGSRDGSSH